MINELERLNNETDFEYGLRLIEAKGDKEIDIDYQDIIDDLHLGIHRDSLRKVVSTTPFSTYNVIKYFKNNYKSVKELSNVPKAEELKYNTSVEITANGNIKSNRLLILTQQELKDVNYLLKAHGYDPKEWELVTAKNNIRNIYNKQDGTQELYTSNITVKPRYNDISLEEMADHFKQMVKDYKPQLVETTPIKNGKILEIPIMDLHLGKLAWDKEVNENYDCDIAEERFNRVIDDFITKTKGFQFEKVIFPIGNDFFNIDNLENSTTKGTRQDVDSRWQRIFLKGVKLLTDNIDKLRINVAPVEVFYVNANHDSMLSFCATTAIANFFNNVKDVIVDTSPNPRKYKEFGNVLIGYTHGEKEGKRINGIMQLEAREAWGRTLYHEWHMAHLHSEQTKEENGIIIRNISSVTGTDAWHHESGFVGAIKKAQAFIWDKEYGLECIINSVIR